MINIGSGIRDWKNWLLLDEISHHNVYPFKSSEDCSIPAESNSADIVYTSHHIEHIPGPALHALLRESHRVLSKSGRLILKYPDYDWFLEQYKAGDTSFVNLIFDGDLVRSWSNFNVENTSENWLAMVFVGYWNVSYGDHFSGRISRAKDAYHGPPRVERDLLKSILMDCMPSEICEKLKKIALADPDFKAFNHQSAWGNEELSSLVEKHKLKNLCYSKECSISLFRELIPDLTKMEEWSSYLVFEKE